jgi:hypothetical protein
MTPKICPFPRPLPSSGGRNPVKTSGGRLVAGFTAEFQSPLPPTHDTLSAFPKDTPIIRAVTAFTNLPIRARRKLSACVFISLSSAKIGPRCTAVKIYGFCHGF